MNLHSETIKASPHKEHYLIIICYGVAHTYTTNTHTDGSRDFLQKSTKKGLHNQQCQMEWN